MMTTREALAAVGAAAREAMEGTGTLPSPSIVLTNQSSKYCVRCFRSLVFPPADATMTTTTGPAVGTAVEEMEMEDMVATASQDMVGIGRDTVTIEGAGMETRILRKMSTATDCRWPTDEWTRARST